jgi:hypothetical protein
MRDFAMPLLMFISYPCSCPYDICHSQPFLPAFLLCHALGQIRTDPAEGAIRIRQTECDDMPFFKVLCIVPQLFFFYFFSPSYSYFLLFLCTFVVAHCARALFPSTNKCLPHSYDFDGHGTSRNDRISYSYNKNLIEQSWCNMRMGE